ncbi:MAG: twin-arginine translocase TatA/TatE family subunit [Coriobacteriia bacterium]
MFGIGGTEFFVIAVIVLMLFGPDKIPEIARTIGRFTREFKRYQTMMESVMKAEMYGMEATPAEDREKVAKEYRKKAGITAPGEETPGGLPVGGEATGSEADAEPVDAAASAPDSDSPGDVPDPPGYSGTEYEDYDPELLAPELADTGWTPGSENAPATDDGEEAGERS